MRTLCAAESCTSVMTPFCSQKRVELYENLTRLIQVLEILVPLWYGDSCKEDAGLWSSSRSMVSTRSAASLSALLMIKWLAEGSVLYEATLPSALELLGQTRLQRMLPGIILPSPGSSQAKHLVI